MVLGFPLKRALASFAISPNSAPNCLNALSPYFELVSLSLLGGHSLFLGDVNWYTGAPVSGFLAS
mgnify:CR=1 FL=1